MAYDPEEDIFLLEEENFIKPIVGKGILLEERHSKEAGHCLSVSGVSATMVMLVVAAVTCYHTTMLCSQLNI